MTFELTEGRDQESGGYKVTISWQGPSDKVFEDCYDFGKNLNITYYI